MPENSQLLLDKLEDRTSPPGGARPALVGGGRVTGDNAGFDPLDGDDDDFGDDED